MQSECKVVRMTDVSALLLGLRKIVWWLLQVRAKRIRRHAYKHLASPSAQVRTLVFIILFFRVYLLVPHKVVTAC